MLTENPLLFNKRPREAAVIPLPREDTTPPVIKINFVKPFPLFS
jgi:hypothetical protein